MNTISNDVVKELAKLPEHPNILVIRLEEQKKCLIYPCRDSVTKLAEILRDIRNGVFPYKEFENNVDKLDIEVYDSYLEEYAHFITATYVKYKYLDMKWNIINKRVYKRNIVSISTGLDHKGRNRVFVELSNANRTKVMVLGVFEKVNEANVFVNKYYYDKYRGTKGKRPLVTPIIALNELTKQYYLETEKVKAWYVYKTV